MGARPQERRNQDPPGSDEEFWTKEMGQALEVRLVQLGTLLTKEQLSELTNPDTNKTHLVLVAERLSANPHFEGCFAVATEDNAIFGSYFHNDRHIGYLRGSGKLFGPWEGGMANNIGFDHQSGAPTRPYGRQANDISLPDLVARPTARDTFEMEQRCLLYISGTPLCDGKGGVGRVACLQPLGSLQHHMPGKYPVLKPKESTALSPDCGDPSHQLRKNTYPHPVPSRLLHASR
jgi:hypothetical protein